MFYNPHQYQNGSSSSGMLRILNEALILSESTLQMQISFNHPVISSFLLISRSFSFCDAHRSRWFTAHSDNRGGNEMEGDEFTFNSVCKHEGNPIDVLAETGNGGHMGRPPLQMKYSKRSYIIHFFRSSVFGRARLKVSLALLI